MERATRAQPLAGFLLHVTLSYFLVRQGLRYRFTPGYLLSPLTGLKITLLSDPRHRRDLRLFLPSFPSSTRNQLPQFFDVLRHGDLRVVLPLVFQRDETVEVRVLEDLHDPRKVRVLDLAAGVHFGLHL